MALSPLIPPYFFSIVLSCPSVNAPLPHNVYRGSPPLPRNLRFLRRLRLKTIVSLTGAPLQDSVLSWAEKEGIECIWHEVGPAGEESLGSGIKESVKPVLQVLLDPSKLPLYVHCSDGGANTSVVLGCLRRLQLWSTESLAAEIARFDTDPSDPNTAVLPCVTSFGLPPLPPTTVPLPSWVLRPAPLAPKPIAAHPSGPSSSSSRKERVDRGDKERSPAGPIHSPPFASLGTCAATNASFDTPLARIQSNESLPSTSSYHPTAGAASSFHSLPSSPSHSRTNSMHLHAGTERPMSPPSSFPASMVASSSSSSAAGTGTGTVQPQQQPYHDFDPRTLERFHDLSLTPAAVQPPFTTTTATSQQPSSGLSLTSPRRPHTPTVSLHRAGSPTTVAAIDSNSGSSSSPKAGPSGGGRYSPPPALPAPLPPSAFAPRSALKSHGGGVPSSPPQVAAVGEATYATVGGTSASSASASASSSFGSPALLARSGETLVSSEGGARDGGGYADELAPGGGGAFFLSEPLEGGETRRGRSMGRTVAWAEEDAREAGGSELDGGASIEMLGSFSEDGKVMVDGGAVFSDGDEEGEGEEEEEEEEEEDDDDDDEEEDDEPEESSESDEEVDRGGSQLISALDLDGYG